ncbi:cytochrome P450 [Podospora aff. communis PSN243]|uniref:Cytochrome P450 n=1 Tax=Podospora aff. communis PSN243 TaxID=3040156 RepID=A0AAV9G574_9PEZI|nr:cytochrome P450 [Podospora aff. communis PSN243]
MDFQVSALLSLVEALLLAGGAHQGKFGLQLDNLPLVDILRFFVICFFVHYGVFKFYRIVIYPHFVSPMRHLPGPKDNHPFLGQFLKLLFHPSPVGLHLKWHHTWPDAPFIRYLGLGNQETLLINTLEAHKEVLQTHCYSFVKPEVLYRFVGEISGRGLLFIEGEQHKRLRRAMSVLFTPAALKKIAPIFQHSAEDLAVYFHKNLDSRGQIIIDSVDMFSKVSLDIAGKTVMGLNLNNLGDEDPEKSFRANYRRLLQPPLLSAIISFINTAVPVRKFIPLEANLGFIRATKNLWRITREAVDQRIVDYDSALERGKPFQSPGLEGIGMDLLTMMVEERNKEKLQDLLTEHELVEQVLTFLAGGHETAATTLSWSAYLLASRPHMQDKLRAEVMELMSKYHDGGRPGAAEVDKLQYLDNFIKECLRRFPPIVNTFREAAHDVTVCNTFIPKGTLLYFSFSVANLSKDVWGPDADEFRPERWENLKGEAASPYAVETFLNGPRMCLGKVFAMMELKAILIELLLSFRFLPAPEWAALGENIPPLANPSITITPKGGLRVVLERLDI